MSEPITTLDTIKTTLETLVSDQIEFAYLLGSAVTERFHSESDIDLAVYWKKVPEFSEMVKIIAKLEIIFKRDVDLVSINTADLVFSQQILETGRLLICHSPGLLLKWKTEQMAQYPDFKYSRKIIEDNILQRKKHV